MEMKIKELSKICKINYSALIHYLMHYSFSKFLRKGNCKYYLITVNEEFVATLDNYLNIKNQANRNHIVTNGSNPIKLLQAYLRKCAKK